MAKKPSQRSVNLMLLAMEIEKFDGPVGRYEGFPCRDLEIKIALSQPQFFNAGPYYEGGKDRIGMFSPEDPEHRMLPGNAPDMLVPDYLSNTDHARLLQPSGWNASMIIQDRWKPEFWYVALRQAGRDDSADCKTDSLAKAWAAAAIRAQAYEAA